MWFQWLLLCPVSYVVQRTLQAESLIEGTASSVCKIPAIANNTLMSKEFIHVSKDHFTARLAFALQMYWVL